VNTCNSKLRKEIPHRSRRHSDDDLEDVATIEDRITQVAVANDVLAALKDLPAHLRIVIVLRYYADLNERDISVVIGRQPGTVKSRLNEARRRLALHPALQAEAPSPINSRKENHS
jgi:RNA polymerase sigma factor (sigma-70 family)